MSTDPWGIDATYEDAAGTLQTVSEQAIEGIRTAIGRPPEEATSLYDERVKVLQQGRSLSLPAAAELTLEDGSVRQVHDRLPDDLPIGYHQLVPKVDLPSPALDRQSRDAAICLRVYAPGGGARKCTRPGAARAGGSAI